MLSNPDLAVPLYVMVVFAGLLLGGAWRAFAQQVGASASQAAGK